MPANTTGFLIHFDEEQRQDLIKDRIEAFKQPFSDALSVRDWTIGDLSIALISFSEDTINYIALAKKGRRVATSKNRVEFLEPLNLQDIPIRSIEVRLDQRIQRFFIKASSGTGGLFPTATWTGLINAIKAERPNLVNEIDHIFAQLRYSGVKLIGETAGILLQEREALGISLDIFSGSNRLREQVLGGWAPPEGTVMNFNEREGTANFNQLQAGQSSFLQGIPKRYIQEESAIQHDLFNWPGMTATHETGTSIFIQGDRRLEVIYANRNSLEATLEIDLIYYNKLYELFVLVQYKLMRDDGGTLLYRPDPQLNTELTRMDKFYNSQAHATDIETHEQYRLNDDDFMLKLVPNNGFYPASGELIKGMYIPREYMHFLISPNGPKGPQGGSQITFENAPRYLTNSQFSESVRKGWIGTRGVQSQMLKDLIMQYYETGRAVLLSYESKLN